MYVIDTVISRNRSVENRLSFALKKLSVVTVKWNVHRKEGFFHRDTCKNMALFRFSYFNNQQQEKKSWLSSFRDQSFLIDDISMPGLSKVDPFPFVFVSMKVSVFPCPSVTDFPLFCSTVLTERKGLKFFRNE